jgi:hypothetical protein
VRQVERGTPNRRHYYKCGVVEVVGNDETRTALSRLPIEKSAWLGAAIADWARVPFIPLVSGKKYERI